MFEFYINNATKNINLFTTTIIYDFLQHAVEIEILLTTFVHVSSCLSFKGAKINLGYGWLTIL